MVTFALHRLLRLKLKHCYTAKGSVDKIQSNGSLIQREWCENPLSNNKTEQDRETSGKRYLNPKNIQASLLGYATGMG